ncbi:hypothetical protein [Sinimarinibacterium thermocellulolyticum]|uniref:Lipoprotein n=1 Tax=Sinimarinibacterium thermocellulolyticum TaxID=3170016 RepID=A0ABV2AD07_9GAMM
MIGALVSGLGACAVDGRWRGAAEEAQYEQALGGGTLAAPRANRFYAEVHRDARIYVFADADVYARFLWSGRIEHAVTAIGAGANGQTVQFALSRAEAREQERRVAWRGAAQAMFEGLLAGDGESFYGEVYRDGRIYVFASWAALQRFRRDGALPDAERLTDFGPEQQTVIVAGPVEATLTRFRAIHHRY